MRAKDVSIKKAVLINGVGRYSSVIFHILFTAIFSRILSPEEFGVVAIINVFVVFFELFSDLGIGTAIIQNQELGKKEHGEIFSFSILLGFILCILFAAVSHIISFIYKDDVYTSVGLMFSIVIALTSFNIVPDALIMKNKKFSFASFRLICANITSYLLALILALKGFSYYSLVIRSILFILIQFILNLVNTGIRPKLIKSFDSINKIKGYSLYQFGASFLNYFQRNLDNLLIGKFWGSKELAYYDKSYTLSRYPVSYLSNIITPVLHPILAEHQADKEYIYKKYMDVIMVLSAVGVFVSGVFISSSREIILLFFGDQWENSVLPFQIISLSLWVQMLTGTVGCIMQSLGNTKRLFNMCSISVLFSVIGISLGVCSKSVTVLSAMIDLVYYIHFIIYFYITLEKGFNMNFFIFLNDIRKEFLALFLMVISAFIFDKMLVFDNLMFCCIVKSMSVLTLYIIFSFTVLRNNAAIKYIRSKVQLIHS